MVAIEASCAFAAAQERALPGAAAFACESSSPIEVSIGAAITAGSENPEYDRERSNQKRFAEMFAGDPDVIMPASTRSGARRAPNRAGAALYRFYVGSLYREGFFNADPHPGNLLLDQNGWLVILDHGCVRRFDGSTVHGKRPIARRPAG
jgi:ABC1 atypical kinase-like domain